MSASQISLKDLQSIRSSYSNLSSTSRPENPSGQCTYRPYDFTDAAKMPIYKIANKTPAEIVAFHNKISAPEYDSMSESDFFDFIQVALSITDPLSNGYIFQTPPYPVTSLCSDYENARPSGHGSVRFRADASIAVPLQVIPPSGSQMNQMDAEESEPVKAKALSFLYSWLTRFSIKTPSAVLNMQYDKLRETYMKFYGVSSAVFDNFRPDSSWIRGIKEAFDSFVRVKNTLIFHVASSETFYKESPKVFNILRYLYYQNLEFMGMHAYVSLVNIMSKVALPPAQILTWLRISGAELAIDEAYKIMSSLDNGMIDNGVKAERLWKYARCLDQGYFNRLQTAYAAELMATLAYIEIKLGISQETGYSSPLNIHILDKNRHIREVGKAKAEAFMICKNSVISLSSDASVVDKMYAANQGVSLSAPGPTPPPEQQEPRKRPHAEIVDPTPIIKKAPPTAVSLSNLPNF
ncbi:MAG: nucleocapsid [Betanucleorhabdovirus taraxi]|uniref:Nucleoprotein n=1 Tax=Taraxacum betanucleorhabdovirus 1 TaxID=2950879 RepID=A0AAE9MQZ0_9RHAB|nr:MAG: nucleocapsid [Taraxacum betanucleorhabdovirus 1]